MPPPTDLHIRGRSPPHRRLLKSRWCACLVIATALFYAKTLVLIGRWARDGGTTAWASGSARAELTTPPSPNGEGRSGKSYRSIGMEIAGRWNLTSPSAPRLLELQFHRRLDDYDPRTDFLHFHHIPKTGGTTISDVLNSTLGELAGGAILPGSHRSGEFDASKLGALRERGGPGGAWGPYPYLASYAHTRLRPIGGPNKTEMASFFEEYFTLPGNARRRLRSLGMLREPMDLRASTMAMALCSLNGRVNSLNWRRRKKGLGPICRPEQGLNVSELIDGIVEKAFEKCPGGITRRFDTTKLNRYEKILCRQGRTAMDYCRSPSHLLSSRRYKAGMRSMLRGLMGRFTAKERMCYDNYRSVEDYLERTGSGFSPEEVEEYTLIDLGGLDPNISYAAYSGRKENRPDAGDVDDRASPGGREPDFLWFGITERMEESTCLLYHALGVRALNATPRERVMDCPTTSWWTEAHREEMKRREPAEYALWRAANAILDVRTAMMKEDVRRKMGVKGGLTWEERDRYASLADAGCLD